MTNSLKRYSSPYEIALQLAQSAGFNKDDIGYDIIVAHQASNTVGYGNTLDPRLDIISPRVWQQASSGTQAGRIVPAADPLLHPDFQANKVGAVVGFAIRLVQHLPLNRRILIIPNAQGGVGHADATWQPGGTLYADTVTRVNALVTANPKNKVLTFFAYIHGGNDVSFWSGNQAAYKTAVKTQIDGFRSSIKTAAAAPFIIGGYSDASAPNGSDRANINAWYGGTLPTERSKILYVAPTGLASEADNLHLTADSQRVMSDRIYQAFVARFMK